MRPYARVRVGRILALGVGVWLRRSLHVHAVAALCLAPLALLPSPRNPVEDEGIIGVFGLYATGWAVSFDLFGMARGIVRNVTAGYLAQFAVTVILVRHAHRRLAGRAPRMGLRGFLGLLLLAAGGLVAFSLLDSFVVASADSHSALPSVLAIAVTVAEAFLAASFWLALPAAAVDGHGFLGALGRSRLLADGSRFSIAIAAALPILLQWALLIPFAAMGGGVSTWTLAVPLLLFLTLKACILAAAYEEACRRKEGPRADEIGAVFA